MKKFHLYYIVSLLFAIAIGSASFAQEANEHLVFQNPNIERSSEGYSLIQLDGCNSWNQQVGKPQLPLLQWIVEISPSAKIEFEILDSIQIDLGNREPICPVQPSLLKNSSPGIWQIDYSTYSQNRYYTLPTMEITPLGIMGKSRIARITVSPIKYNPQSNQIIIYTHIAYRINGMQQRKSAVQPERYVAVIPHKYKEIAQPLLQWRAQLGWKVDAIYTHSGNRDNIRATLKERYLRGEGADYLLLIGGIDDIKCFSGRFAPSGLNNKWTDMYYGEYTNDYYPEAMIGRLSVNDSNELRQVIAKIINYEQNPDTSVLGKSLILAGQEDRQPAPTTTNGQVNYIGQQLSALTDTVCFRNPNSINQKDSIIATVKRGMGLINYTSHCVVDSWSRPHIEGGEFDSIATATSIWINNCCLSNQIGKNSLGEQLLRQPQGGGVGIIGSTNETLWEEDYYWSIGAKRPITTQPIYDSAHLGAIDHLLQRETLGEILRAGNMNVTTVGSPYEAFYWEIYNLFGDPATRPYIGIAPRLESPQFETFNVGGSTLALTGEANACVTIWQNGRLIGKDILNEQGAGNITLIQPLDITEAIVTSSKAWHRPQIDTITPQQPQEGWLSVQLLCETDSIALDETIPIQIIYKNVGIDTVKNHQIKIFQTAEDSMGAWLEQAYQLTIDKLAPNKSDTAHTTISIAELNQLSLLMAHLRVDNNNTEYTNQELKWYVKRSNLNTLIKVYHNGETITSIKPHQTYELQWKLTNNSPYPIEQVDAQLTIHNYPSKKAITFEYQFSLNAHKDSCLVIPFSTEDTLQGILITSQIIYDGITTTNTLWWIAENAKEDFEDGALSHYPWMNHSLMPWTIDSSTFHSGKYSLRSGKIYNRQRCDITLWVDIENPDTIGFWYKTSSEGNKDFLQFYVDSRQSFFKSGLQDWQYFSEYIPKGKHKLTWRYQKNDTESFGEDAVWIDDIDLPFCTWDDIYGTMDTHIYNVPINIEPIENIASWHIWPNPARNYINIECSENGIIEIWDCMGKKIEEFKIENSSITQYSTTKLRFGLYLLVFTNSKGSSTKKLMITP